MMSLQPGKNRTIIVWFGILQSLQMILILTRIRTIYIRAGSEHIKKKVNAHQCSATSLPARALSPSFEIEWLVGIVEEADPKMGLFST
jgi:hypothetical protein